MTFIPDIYTVESVTSGHPDKVCDLIADTLLDAYLQGDPNSRVAIEVLGSRNMIHLAGEVTSKSEIDKEQIVRSVLEAKGYKSQDFAIHSDITIQSPEIATGVDIGGAGDQGIMYGFATNETPEMLPLGLVLAHRLTQRLEESRSTGELDWIGPDGKAQVTMVKNHPTHIVVSTQHSKTIDLDDVREQVRSKIIYPVLNELAERQLVNLERIMLHINPAGPFTIGGFDSDTGLTGRKTQVDTYGGIIPHGGGAFSGKDATKVDRSAAYMARNAAKWLVSKGYAEQCLVSVAYVIGEPKPLMLTAQNEHGRELNNLISGRFDFRPSAIIDRLKLNKPYFAVSCNGHFIKQELEWEK